MSFTQLGLAEPLLKAIEKRQTTENQEECTPVFGENKFLL